MVEEADDGVLHDLWRNRIDPDRADAVVAILRRLVINRGRFTKEDRADAFALASDVGWPLDHLPIVQEALAS